MQAGRSIQARKVKFLSYLVVPVYLLFYRITIFSPKPAIFQNCYPAYFAWVTYSVLLFGNSCPNNNKTWFFLLAKLSRNRFSLSSKSLYGHLTSMSVYVDSQQHDTSFIFIEKHKNTTKISNYSPVPYLIFLTMMFKRFMPHFLTSIFNYHYHL